MVNKIKTRSNNVVARDQWIYQMNWVVAFLERLAVNKSSHGSKWTRNMMAHYNKRFVRHCRHTPKACEKLKQAYVVRVNQANKLAQTIISDS